MSSVLGLTKQQAKAGYQIRFRSLVLKVQILPRLPSSYKRALKKGNLYRVIDRTDLSLLPSDVYTVSFFTNQTLYETSYKLHLQH